MTDDAIRIGRNFIRVGDRVKVSSSPGKRDSYETVVRRFFTEGEARFAEVAHPKNGAIRSVNIERLVRKQQTKGGERIVTRKGS